MSSLFLAVCCPEWIQVVLSGFHEIQAVGSLDNLQRGVIYLDPALLLNPVPWEVCRPPFCGVLREFCALQVGVWIGLLGLLLQRGANWVACGEAYCFSSSQSSKPEIQVSGG